MQLGRVGSEIIGSLRRVARTWAIGTPTSDTRCKLSYRYSRKYDMAAMATVYQSQAILRYNSGCHCLTLCLLWDQSLRHRSSYALLNDLPECLFFSNEQSSIQQCLSLLSQAQVIREGSKYSHEAKPGAGQSQSGDGTPSIYLPPANFAPISADLGVTSMRDTLLHMLHHRLACVDNVALASFAQTLCGGCFKLLVAHS